MQTKINEFIQSFSRQQLIVIASIFTAIVYWFLHTRYYIYYIDDAWEIARMWDYIHKGIMEDAQFRPVDAPDRILVFGNTYFIFYGYIMEVIGWTKGNAILISGLCLLLASIVWQFILQHLKFSKNLRLFFFFSMLLFPAFFNASHLARNDAFVFLFASIALLLFMKKQHFLSGVVIMMGFEAHAMGAIAGFYIAAYVLYQWQNYIKHFRASLLKLFAFLLGLAAGIGYYFWMRGDTWTYEIFSNVMLLNKNMTNDIGNYLLTYFIQSRWYRHAWELLFLIVTFSLYFKHKLYRQQRFIWIFLSVMVASTFVTGRPNNNYMIFVYPAILLLTLHTYEHLHKFRALAAFLGVVFTLLYGGHYLVNRNFDYQEITEKTTALLPQDGIAVVGMPDNWFASIGRQFYPIYHSVYYLPELNIPVCYLIRNDYIGHHSKNYEELIAYFDANYSKKLIGRFEAFDGEWVEVFYYGRK